MKKTQKKKEANLFKKKQNHKKHCVRALVFGRQQSLWNFWGRPLTRRNVSQCTRNSLNSFVSSQGFFVHSVRASQQDCTLKDSSLFSPFPSRVCTPKNLQLHFRFKNNLQWYLEQVGMAVECGCLPLVFWPNTVCEVQCCSEMGHAMSAATECLLNWSIQTSTKAGKLCTSCIHKTVQLHSLSFRHVCFVISAVYAAENDPSRFWLHQTPVSTRYVLDQ